MVDNILYKTVADSTHKSNDIIYPLDHKPITNIVPCISFFKA